MSQSLILKAAGLYTHPNELSRVPDGALEVADNVVIDREGIVEPRRGFDRLGFGFADSSERAEQLAFFQEVLIAHYNTNELARYNSGSGWTNYSGTYNAPASDVRMRFAQANENLYFTTDGGTKKLDSPTGTPVDAGAPQGLTIEGSTTGSSGFLADDFKVAYRMVWYYIDANNNFIFGAPSERVVVTNTSGGTRDVSITFTVPSGITTDYFYQVYRSEQIDINLDEPSDELQLVYEAAYASGSTITFTDNVPDALRGATIYTASSQEGILQANTRPPMAKDIAVFNGSMFYANTSTKHRYFLSLLAVGGSSGIANDDTITIAGTTYTGKAAEDVSAAEFDVATGGSASQNITDTAKSLVKVINQHTSNTAVYAYYLSGPDDLPGQILIEERGVGGSSFALTSSRATCWGPQLPSTGTTQSSSNDTFKNGLYFSKFQQPEAVPITNFQRVGSAESEIKRILPLRESLFILKENDGVFRLTGLDSNSFRIDLFDNTTRIVAPETAVVLNNQIFCLSDQGVVAITETGVSVVSRPIENTLLNLFGVNLGKVRDLSFSVAYETDRKFILFTITESSDTSPTQAFVYNIFTDTWTRWTLEADCGLVDPFNDFLYLGDANSEYVLKELKQFNFRDHVDFGTSSTISNWDSSTRTLTLSNTTDIDVGDIIYQSDTIYSVVTEVDSDAGTVVVQFGAAFTAAAATVYKGIDTKVQWVPVTGGNPGILKQFMEMSMFFGRVPNLDASLGFKTEIAGAETSVEITGSSPGLWGLFPWGSVPWGGGNTSKPIRTYIPRDQQRAMKLIISFSHKVGYSAFQLSGLSILYNKMSGRLMR